MDERYSGLGHRIYSLRLSTSWPLAVRSVDSTTWKNHSVVDQLQKVPVVVLSQKDGISQSCWSEACFGRKHSPGYLHHRPG